MNGPADVMIQTEGNHEMDTKWAQGLTVLGIDGDLVDFIILTGQSTKGGSVYRYEC
jgi:hypothetical protein